MKQSQDQLKISSFLTLKEANPKSSDEDISLPPATASKGTRSFPMYSVSEDVTMLKFVKFMRSVDGKSRSEKVAREIAVDVSKFLKFAGGPMSLEPHFDRMLDRDQLVAYMEKLKTHGCGPEGMLGKLDAFESALSFIRLFILKDDDTNTLYGQSLRMSETLKRWRSTLRKQKALTRAIRLETLSDEKLSLDEITAMIESENIWDTFVSTLSHDQPTAAMLREATVVIAALILYKSWQRPGAVQNCTLDEYNKKETVQIDDNLVTVIRVMQHKTGQSGSAKLLLSQGDLSRLKSYVEVLRPHCDPNDQCQNLLVLPYGKKIGKLNNLLKSLGDKYGIKLPSATRVRKIGATSTVKNVSGPSTSLVQRQLSHSSETDNRFYQAITGKDDAAKAFRIMETLRLNTSTSPKTTDTMSPPPLQQIPSRKRQPFTKDEEETLRKYFGASLSEGKHISLNSAKQFLAAHPSHRTPKQIQDKIRNIIKYD